jgi:uncharacterized protein
MRPSEIVSAHRHEIIALACSAGAARVRLFGSVAKGTDDERSDVDLLVDLPEGISLLKVTELQLALSDLLGLRVDLCTERELEPSLKPRILAEARAL